MYGYLATRKETMGLVQSVRYHVNPAIRAIRSPWLVRELRQIDARRPLDRPQAERLVRLWSDLGWSADPDYLMEVGQLCRTTGGPILECGSGLTTLVAGVYAPGRCWSLEHDLRFRQRTLDAAKKMGVRVQVFHAPLVEYAGFRWYECPDALVDTFDAVVCDGPPGDEGGRFGLMPVMADRLNVGAVLLVDDVHRPRERGVVDRWKREYNCVPVRASGNYMVLRVGG